MKVVVRIAGHERDLDVVLRHPGATLGDLLEAVTGRRTGGNLGVDERTLPASTPLLAAGLTEGAVVGPDGAVPAALVPGVQLVVTGGLDAGLRRPLDGPATTVGRGSAADVVLPSRTLSRRHVTFLHDDDGRLRVRDEDSSNGTTLDGRTVPGSGLPLPAAGAVVRAGSVALTVRDERPTDRAHGLDLHGRVGPAGTVRFHRQERARTPSPPVAVSLPARAGPASEVRVGVAVVVGPLLLAGVTVAVTGDPRFALVGALGPVLGLGAHLAQRRRAAKADRAAAADFAAALAVLETQLDDAAAAERARLQELCPDPAELLRRAALPTVRLWERRPASPGFLTVHAGVADLPWTPTLLDGPAERAPEVDEALGRPRLLAAPVQIDLAGGTVVGVVGDRAAALAVARSLVCQAAVQSGPADLAVAVLVDEGREAAWDWAKWLPHTRRSGGDRWLSAGRERSEVLLRALADGGSGAPALLVVLDSDVLGEGADAPAHPLLSGGRRAARPGADGGRQVAGVVLAATEDQLPAACSTVVVVGDDGGAVVRYPEGAREVPDVLAAGLSTARARACARDLARFDDTEPAVVGGRPDVVRLLPLLGLERVDAASVRRRWEAASAEEGVSATVGVTEAGVFTLDLVRDGPHVLVGGTTGSGRSEFLRSLVAALAAGNDPTRLTFVLVDVGGGGALDVCSRLPHTVDTVRDLDGQRADRLLRALEAEVQHRARLVAAVGVDDHGDDAATPPPAPLPRLLIVVDDVAPPTGASDLLPRLVGLATAGRTLGVHLLLATPRPTEDLLTGTCLRVALSAADAGTVHDVPDGAALGHDRAGRADVTLGSGEVVPIRTALVCCVTSREADAPVEVRPFAFGPPAEAPQQTAATGDAPTDLERLVDAFVQAALDAGTAPPRRPRPEALGAPADLDALGDPVDDRVLVVLPDDPDHRARHPTG